MKPLLYLGKGTLRLPTGRVEGKPVTLAGEEYYQIANYDRMRPFFMTVVSEADHWMFISSNGALSAGRRNPDLALFPYYTDDKIRDMVDASGSKTILLVQKQGRSYLWEPLAERGRGNYRVRRNLYKNFRGNKLMFEELNQDLGVSFRYGWFNSNRFGFVRRAWLTNTGPSRVGIKLLDGLQNLMPCGTGSQFNLEYSTLLDAYKRSELLADTGLGLFRLSAIPVDRPEPAEALRATSVWSLLDVGQAFQPAGVWGFPAPRTGTGGWKAALTGRQECLPYSPPRPRAHGSPLRLLSALQLDRFRQGLPLQEETDVRGERGAYLVQSEVMLRPGQVLEWLVVADVNQGPSDVASLNRLLRKPAALRKQVLADIDRGTRELERIVAAADGLQKSARPLNNARHYANTLFNVMRGGIFNDGYKLDPADLRASVTHANKTVAERHASFFRNLPKPALYSEMVTAAAQTGDPQFERLCREYLPLTFSRRHGDPTRPWNRFSIATRGADGKRLLYYEGNWRDLFQNWEALAVSFPGYVSGMICRFLNASTADGYNPYRVTRDGIDWEVVNPHDPWSYIGYWGDHQLIYLLKLLEILDRHDPATLHSLLTQNIFAYANVPYRIRPYADVLANPKETVVFDDEVEELVRRRVRSLGADGKLVWDKRGAPRLVNLAEKLLVPLLVKLSNFIPEAGLWLNTQRPEWNDANNALVGNGASMVTLYYLRRHLQFCQRLFRGQIEALSTPLAREGECPREPTQLRKVLEVRAREDARPPGFQVSAEVAGFFSAVKRILEQHHPLLAGTITDGQRRRVADHLGGAGSVYRSRLYQHGFSGTRRPLTGQQVLEFLDSALEWVNHSIEANRRSDGLYHAYNLIRLERKAQLPIRRLYEMLEGQVAVLSSGHLSATESLEVLTALRRSAMYRADQHSYLLYPNRELPRFIDRNNLPPAEVRRLALLRTLVADGNRQLIERDINGRVHFNGLITNARDLRRILDQLAASGYARRVKRDGAAVLGLFERLFDHESFTGRSGTFFGYEGLGSIYWHMVSKLLLAAQETYFRAAAVGAPPCVLKGLAECYYDIRAGIGDYKTPEAYGAFPMDPYSHTPAQGGARQPGLTGQVKEDWLCRFGELGVIVENGQIHFRPRLLRHQEFLTAPGEFVYYELAGGQRRLHLKAGELAFTYCQVPVVYRLAPADSLTVIQANGARRRADSLSLEPSESRELFERTGRVGRIEVGLALGPEPGVDRAGNS